MSNSQFVIKYPENMYSDFKRMVDAEIDKMETAIMPALFKMKKAKSTVTWLSIVWSIQAAIWMFLVVPMPENIMTFWLLIGFILFFILIGNIITFVVKKKKVQRAVLQCAGSRQEAKYLYEVITAVSPDINPAWHNALERAIKKTKKLANSQALESLHNIEYLQNGEREKRISIDFDGCYKNEVLLFNATDEERCFCTIRIWMGKDAGKCVSRRENGLYVIDLTGITQLLNGENIDLAAYDAPAR